MPEWLCACRCGNTSPTGWDLADLALESQCRPQGTGTNRAAARRSVSDRSPRLSVFHVDFDNRTSATGLQEAIVSATTATTTTTMKANLCPLVFVSSRVCCVAVIQRLLHI